MDRISSRSATRYSEVSEFEIDELCRTLSPDGDHQNKPQEDDRADHGRRQLLRHNANAPPIVPMVNQEEGHDQHGFEEVAREEAGGVLEGSSAQAAMQHDEGGCQ